MRFQEDYDSRPQAGEFCDGSGRFTDGQITPPNTAAPYLFTGMTLRITLPDEQTRATTLASGMEGGMEASYRRLNEMI
jgi:hypothetical protein